MTRQLPSWLIGLVLAVVIAIGFLLGYTKKLPFGDPYEVHAVFSTAQSIRTKSPVRIAGVNVGEVTRVEHLSSGQPALSEQSSGAPKAIGSANPSGGQASVVTIELKESALPLHSDATLKLRPRLFLEGNLFVDVDPGSPSAPVVEEDHLFPISQTAVSVQLDQVLTTLQSDVRRDLQVLLDQLGNSLIKHGGAEGLRQLYRTSPAAFRFTSQVTEALLGTEPADLQGAIRGLDRVVAALGSNEVELQDLVSNLRVVSGAFAAEEAALGRAIDELPGVLRAARPAFSSLNAAFPGVRAFAREALPGVRSLPETLDVATPWIHQVRGLVSRQELRGLATDLRPTIPRLATLARETIPFLGQSRALASCFNEVVIPWSGDSVYAEGPYPHPAPETEDGPATVYEETGYSLTGVSGESRTGDANGQFIRVAAGGGANTVIVPPTDLPGDTRDEPFFGLTSSRLLGSAPAIVDSAKTRFEPDSPCERQDPPDLGTSIGPPPEQESVAATPADELGGPVGAITRQALTVLGENAASARQLAEAWSAFVSRGLPRYQRELQGLLIGGSG